MGVTVAAGAGACTYWKGALDRILELCTFAMQDGKTVPLTERMRKQILQKAEMLSDQALRVLAFAKQETGHDGVFLGLAGMIDPPRAAARTAIRT